MTLSILRRTIRFLLGPSVSRAHTLVRANRERREVCTDTRTHTHAYEKPALLVVSVNVGVSGGVSVTSRGSA